MEDFDRKEESYKICNDCLHAAVTSLTKNQAEHYDKYNCLRRLPDDVRTCRNYAYLLEIYDAVRATD
ncbi:soluble guanylyl cyclase alpha-1 subunit, partial [Danaus plexippus plexippus]